MRELEPDLRVILAPNPSPMTGPGTNTYLLGQREIVIIDPGPEDARHLAAIRAAIGGADVAGVLVTHAHLDHSPLARAFDAPVHAFGDARAGRSARMAGLGEAAGGGEGVDAAFRPDHWLGDGEELVLGDERIRAIWTPGHFGNHLCFAWRGAVFSGDHVMGWSSTFVSPPDGDIGAYMRALDRLEGEGARVLYAGHGDPVTEPGARIAALRAHRLGREAAILQALADGARSVAEIVAVVYADVPVAMHGAAARNVFAHLIDLEGRGRVVARPALGVDARYELCFT
ncbi:MAG: MBL fold metallo-hydrolase [Rhodobacteraceae bacterium]|nr:MAG: MBL fold metallo-hydrolase [Paracoccaceae bacterium]